MGHDHSGPTKEELAIQLRTEVQRALDIRSRVGNVECISSNPEWTFCPKWFFPFAEVEFAKGTVDAAPACFLRCAS